VPRQLLLHKEEGKEQKIEGLDITASFQPLCHTFYCLYDAEPVPAITEGCSSFSGCLCPSVILAGLIITYISHNASVCY
jgi:hypothetical protein